MWRIINYATGCTATVLTLKGHFFLLGVLPVVCICGLYSVFKKSEKIVIEEKKEVEDWKINPHKYYYQSKILKPEYR